MGNGFIKLSFFDVDQTVLVSNADSFWVHTSLLYEKNMIQ